MSRLGRPISSAATPFTPPPALAPAILSLFVPPNSCVTDRNAFGKSRSTGRNEDASRPPISAAGIRII
ncbi:hypothetical protein KM043_003803 [Ampulex compressa]|nr:hypothetical protein KM043_003803 [Ampulex compressa]